MRPAVSAGRICIIRTSKSIGQGFADEIFRVYRREHPGVNISFVHAISSIRRMIEHVRNTK